uniref:Bm10689 n=1 Tax=Brugia malayi TaxID=6279 RepID=A0A1I9G3Y7_BRUMA|nr:Bm10689 [Brugia malayi]
MKNNETFLFEAVYRNAYNLNLLTKIYERANLVPVAAVIPALRVYIVTAAVEKLVVGSASQDLIHPLDEN